VWARFFANKDYETDPTPAPPSAVSNGDTLAVVPSALFAQRDGEFSDGSAFPDMGVQGAAKVTNAGNDGFVSFKESRSPGEGLNDGCGGINGGFDSITSKPKRRGRQCRRFP
jgi:hypothetical protein